MERERIAQIIDTRRISILVSKPLRQLISFVIYHITVVG